MTLSPPLVPPHRVQDHFARYPAHGLLATTHLLLKHATGNKYSSAIKWGIPAVADSWLFESAVSQKIAPVDPHLLREEEEEEGKWEEEGEGEGEGKGGAEDDMEEGESDYEEMDSILKGVVICFNRKLPSLTLSSKPLTCMSMHVSMYMQHIHACCRCT